MTTVVTGVNDAGLALYGRTMIETFDRFWPRAVDLVVYADSEVALPRGTLRRQSESRGLAAFLERHRDNKSANGLSPRDGKRDKHQDRDYSYRFDAVRFAPMVFHVRDAAERTADNVLVWLDADTSTFATVPQGFAEDLLGQAAVAYLGRSETHSECGFMAFRLPEAMPLIAEYARPLDDDSVFFLAEWHSSYLFDRARETTGVPCRNLSPGLGGKVWQGSPLGRYMVHLKGPRRKEAARAERITAKAKRHARRTR